MHWRISARHRFLGGLVPWGKINEARAEGTASHRFRGGPLQGCRRRRWSSHSPVALARILLWRRQGFGASPVSGRASANHGRAFIGFGAGISASWPGISARHRCRGGPVPVAASSSLLARIEYWTLEPPYSRGTALHLICAAAVFLGRRRQKAHPRSAFLAKGNDKS